MPTSDGDAYSSMSMGRGEIPSFDSMAWTFSMSPWILVSLSSSCHARMSGTVLVALAWVRKFSMSEMLSEKLGPWIGVVLSIDRIRLYVWVQKSSKDPFAEFQVLSASFHGA